MTSLLQTCVMSIIFWQISCHQVDILKCPHRMSPFPGKEDNTWICDCQHPFVYYSETNSCHEIYFEGPCPTNHYLAFPPGELNAKCLENPCQEYAVVPFNGNCTRLYSSGPHCPKKDTKLFVSDDFQLECSIPRSWSIITAPSKICEKGTRRNSLGECKRVLE